MTSDDHQQRISGLEARVAELARELRFRDERISELKIELDEGRNLVRRMEEHIQERDEYLETFVSTFGLTLSDDDKWVNGEFIQGYNDHIDKFNDLVGRYNKLVRDYNHYAVPPQPVGRPVAASEAQQAQIIKHHKAGKSSRWIAEEMTLSRRTVTTVTGKLDGADRVMTKRRRQLGLEPKPPKTWRRASMDQLPKTVTKHFKKGRELLKEAKGLK